MVEEKTISYIVTGPFEFYEPQYVRGDFHFSFATLREAEICAERLNFHYNYYEFNQDLIGDEKLDLRATLIFYKYLDQWNGCMTAPVKIFIKQVKIKEVEIN